ncbi:3'(2'),5'-bisphosphate nucleotidase [Cladobotryum mycophilum]|uniref:3'(2'),5'-bisphosphate nucleotidase n=1 Tax=Cladobotryum mycophilum TaxID=491253 RepID=A0ABR0SE61_9HYPO
MDHSLHRERSLAEQIVLQAAILTKKVLSTVQEISKADASPVTVADFAAQALIIGAIHRAFPGDGFVGEEDAGVLRGDAALRARVYELVSSVVVGVEEGEGLGPVSEEEMLDLIDLGGRGQGGSGGDGGGGRFWVMDPVDGTATFLRNEQYAVSLALIEDGRELLGVLCCPNLKLKDGRVHESSVDGEGLGVMLSAVRGQGSTIRTLSTRDNGLPNPQPLARLAPQPATQTSTSSTASPRLGARYPGTDVWSSHVRYASLIIGGGDVLVRIPGHPGSRSFIWDHAGAQLIYTEMGGKVTDVNGKEMDFGAGRCLDRNYGLVAAGEDIHDRILQLTRELMAEEAA